MQPKTILAAGLAIMLAAAPFAALAQTLKIGDPAPIVKFSGFSKGKEVKELKKGQVYVVEFWATWCGPCRTSIPHITELAKANKNVTFLGVSVYESPETTKADVDKFVAEMGDQMDYNVALDSSDKTMATTWMEAANQPGIPTAFIVDKEGKIAWIGHPMNMEEPLSKVVAGTWNVNNAKEAQVKAATKEKELNEFYTKSAAAFESKDWKAVVTNIDETLKAKPHLNEELLPLKAQLQLEYDIPAAQKTISEVANGVGKDNAMLLNQMAWALVDPDTALKGVDYKLAAEVAGKAVKASNEKDANIMDTYGLALFLSGDKKKAIEVQTKAVILAESDPETDPQTLEELRARLTQFKKG